MSRKIANTPAIWIPIELARSLRKSERERCGSSATAAKVDTQNLKKYLEKVHLLGRVILVNVAAQVWPVQVVNAVLHAEYVHHAVKREPHL